MDGRRGPLRSLADHPAGSWLIAGFLYWLAQQADFPTVAGVPLTRTQSIAFNTLIPLAAAFLVAPIALAPQGAGVIRRVLSSRAAIAVGTVSYGIYLWHMIAIYQTRMWIIDGTIPRSAAIQAILVVVMTAAGATISYYLVEAPMMRWSARAARGRGGVRSSPPRSGISLGG